MENGQGLDKFKKKFQERFGNGISFTNDDYKRVSNVKIPDLKVDNIVDVKYLDITPHTVAQQMEANGPENPNLNLNPSLNPSLNLNLNLSPNLNPRIKLKNNQKVQPKNKLKNN